MDGHYGFHPQALRTNMYNDKRYYNILSALSYKDRYFNLAKVKPVVKSII